MSCACGARLSGLPDAWRSRWRTGGQAKRKLPARRPLEGNHRALEAHQIASLMSAFGGKADIGLVRCTCLLLTQSGHSSAHTVPRADCLNGKMSGPGSRRT